MELEVTAMACLQLQMSEVPAGIWEHQTKGMVDVNFRVWKVIEHSIFNRLQMGNISVPVLVSDEPLIGDCSNP